MLPGVSCSDFRCFIKIPRQQTCAILGTERSRYGLLRYFGSSAALLTGWCHAGIRAGNEKELQEALTVAERKVARLAELGADVVMIMGAPPTMVRGHGADREIADSLTTKYKIPVTVATIAQVDAFRALGMKKLVGITYFQNDMEKIWNLLRYDVDAALQSNRV